MVIGGPNRPINLPRLFQQQPITGPGSLPTTRLFTNRSELGNKGRGRPGNVGDGKVLTARAQRRGWAEQKPASPIGSLVLLPRLPPAEQQQFEQRGGALHPASESAAQLGLALAAARAPRPIGDGDSQGRRPCWLWAGRLRGRRGAGRSGCAVLAAPAEEGGGSGKAARPGVRAAERPRPGSSGRGGAEGPGALEQPAGSGERKMEEKGGSGGDAGGEQLRVVKHELRTGERPAPCRPGSARGPALGCAGRGSRARGARRAGVPGVPGGWPEVFRE